MNPLPPFAIMEAARRLVEPEDILKFTLIFDGDLPSSGNQSKPMDAGTIRNIFHDQLADLWDTHALMRQLRHEARVMPEERVGVIYIRPPTLPDYQGSPPALKPDEVDLCAPIPVPGAGSFIPFVRNSLHLACAVDVLFLRHEEPMALMRQGGDLDGRLKTLFDALKMPNPKDRYVGPALTEDPLYVVLEDDALISDFSIKSGRLLGRAAKKKHEVRLTIDITVKVLRVFQQNQHLIGG